MSTIKPGENRKFIYFIDAQLKNHLTALASGFPSSVLCDTAFSFFSIGACTSPDLICGLHSIKFWSAVLESSCGIFQGLVN
jgi:hypothetical protein